MAVQIQFRRDTAANWASANPVLAAGEMGVETDTRKYKLGDGATAWSSLAYSVFDGFTPGRRYVFDDTVTDADPGAGKLRFDNATFASITKLYVDNSDDAGGDATAWLDMLDDSSDASFKGTLLFQKVDDPDVYREFVVSGAVTDGTGYRKVPVTPLTQNGALAAADKVAVTFYRSASASVDTSRLLPAGGTTGQILTKASATNYDVGWQDAPEGGDASTLHTPEQHGGGPAKTAAENVTAINAALAAIATAGGGTLDFPSPGVYQIDEPLDRLVLGSGEHIAIRNSGGGILRYVGTAAAMGSALAVLTVGGISPYVSGDTVTTLPAISTMPEPQTGDPVELASPTITYASAHGRSVGDVIMVSAWNLRRAFGTITGTLVAGETLQDGSGNSYTVVKVVESDHIIVRMEGAAPEVDTSGGAVTLTATSDSDTIAVAKWGGTAGAGRITYHMGEILRVLAVPTTTTIVVDRSPKDDYRPLQAYLTTFLMDMPSIDIEGLKIEDDGDHTPAAVLCVVGADAPRLRGVVAKGGYGQTIQTIHTLGAELEGCEARMICPSTGRPADDAGAGNQYGYHNTAGQGTKVRGGWFHGTRHGIDNGGSHCFAEIHVSGAKLSNDFVYGAAGLHGCSRDSGYHDCDIFGGMILSGRRPYATANRIHGVAHQEAIYASEMADWNLKIVGNDIFAYGADHRVSGYRGCFFSFTEGADYVLAAGTFLFEYNTCKHETGGQTTDAATALFHFTSNGLRKKPDLISLRGTKFIGTAQTWGIQLMAGSSITAFPAVDISGLWSNIGGLRQTGTGGIGVFTAIGAEIVKATVASSEGYGIYIRTILTQANIKMCSFGWTYKSSIVIYDAGGSSGGDLFVQGNTCFRYSVSASGDDQYAVVVNGYRYAAVLDNIFRSGETNASGGLRSTSGGTIFHKNVKITNGGDSVSGPGTVTAY